jgi:hypothetical protein
MGGKHKMGINLVVGAINWIHLAQNEYGNDGLGSTDAGNFLIS